MKKIRRHIDGQQKWEKQDTEIGKTTVEPDHEGKRQRERNERSPSARSRSRSTRCRNVMRIRYARTKAEEAEPHPIRGTLREPSQLASGASLPSSFSSSGATRSENVVCLRMKDFVLVVARWESGRQKAEPAGRSCVGPAGLGRCFRLGFEEARSGPSFVHFEAILGKS